VAREELRPERRGGLLRDGLSRLGLMVRLLRFGIGPDEAGGEWS
jgi:hypothetical protein